MTSRLEEQAERDLERMQAARDAKGRGKGGGKSVKPAKATEPQRARFVNTTSEAMGRPGVYWIGTAQDRATGEAVELEPQWVCSPLEVAALTRDGNGNEWGRLLVFTDRDGQEHRWAMPMAMLAGSGEELRAELLRQGLELTTIATRRGKLAEYIGQARPEAKARCVLRTGWHGGAFVLPAQTYGEPPGEPVIFKVRRRTAWRWAWPAPWRIGGSWWRSPARATAGWCWRCPLRLRGRVSGCWMRRAAASTFAAPAVPASPRRWPSPPAYSDRRHSCGPGARPTTR